MVRFRAYTAKGLSPHEIAVLVAICSFTFFAFGTILYRGQLVLLYEPQILRPLAELSPFIARRSNIEAFGRLVGMASIAFLHALHGGRLAAFPAIEDRRVRTRLPSSANRHPPSIWPPRSNSSARRASFYFALPADTSPNFMIVLGAFLLSFSAGLLSQVPGGIGVMEAVFLAIMPGVPPTSSLPPCSSGGCST